MLEDTLNTIFSIMWIYDVLILNFGMLITKIVEILQAIINEHQETYPL